LGVDAKIGSPHFDVFEIHFLVNDKNDNNYKVLSEYLDVTNMYNIIILAKLCSP